MIFHQFHERLTGSLSYLIGCPLAGEALLIDPVQEQTAQYLNLLRAKGLKLRWLVETHQHVDHVSAAPMLRASGAAPIAAPTEAVRGCIDRTLKGGETLYLGEERLAVLHTPGHTPCSISLRWRDRLFTGHTLLVGSVGCHGEIVDPDALYDSVMRLYQEPDDSLVYPGTALDGRRVSCIAQERATNALLPAGLSREAFLSRLGRDRVRAMTQGGDE